MSSTADQSSALANDSKFKARVMALALQYATLTVYVEDPQTPNHLLRLNYAKSVINGGGGNIPSIIANGPNLIASVITYDFSTGDIKTDASDGAISSQIATDWNMLAGI